MSRRLAPQTSRDFRWTLARDCLEEMAMLRGLRRPQPSEPWRAPARSEARLLAQIDAVLALGADLVSAVSAWTFDEDEIPDPDRVFAATLTLGCIEDRRSAESAVSALARAIGRDPAEREAAIEALCLAPHPDLSAVLLPLLDDARPGMRAAAARILGFRGALSQTQRIGLLADPDPEVAAAGCEGELDCREPDLRDALTRTLAHPHDQVVSAALAATARCGLPTGRARALELCRAKAPLRCDAALHLALFGCEEDYFAIESALQGTPHSLTVRAAGYYGHPALVPALLAVLDAPADDDLALETGRALARITGAQLTESRPVEIYEPEDHAFLDRPPEPETLDVPSTDPAAWRDWLAANRNGFRRGVRTRLGMPFGPRPLALGIDGEPVTLGDPISRTLAHLELAMLAGDSRTHFSTLDFIRVQERAVGAWQRWAAGREADPTMRGWSRY